MIDATGCGNQAEQIREPVEEVSDEFMRTPSELISACHSVVPSISCDDPGRRVIRVPDRDAAMTRLLTSFNRPPA